MPIKVELFFYITNHGDGSCGIKYFTTKEARDAYAEADEESDNFEGFCDNDNSLSVLVHEDGTVEPISPYVKLNPTFNK